jgi:Na+-transporting methylmalonyl-CoA/oxaloacetate decarboxylase gamma subunit
VDELIVGLRVTVVGLGVVFIALTTVYAVLTLFIRLERRFTSKQTEAVPPSEPA